VVLENDGFWGNLSVMENLRIFAAAKNIPWEAAQRYIQEWWGSVGFIRHKKKVRLLSRGQRMQCALCRAFMGWPQVYFLDEPTTALDVDAYDHFCRLMRHAQEQGASAIISSHSLETIDTLCSEIGLLQNKSISYISHFHRDVARLEWVIAAPFDARWAEIIKETTKLPAHYSQGAYYCMIADPHKTVPLLINRLVLAGCEVYQVRPQTSSLKDTVKVFYPQSGGGAA
jgi:ABC-2 type transport system ATP-binding protein